MGNLAQVIWQPLKFNIAQFPLYPPQVGWLGGGREVRGYAIVCPRVEAVCGGLEAKTTTSCPCMLGVHSNVKHLKLQSAQRRIWTFSFTHSIKDVYFSCKDIICLHMSSDFTRMSS